MIKLGNSKTIVNGASDVEILRELASLLNVNSFKTKSKICYLNIKESIYIDIYEKTICATICNGESPKEEFKFFDSPRELESLTLKEIYGYQKFKNNKYVLPYSIDSHSCDKFEPCPICLDGNCTECHGKKTVVCDACDGDKYCHSCDGSGRYPCYSCNETGQCSYCDGTGEEDCDDCDGDGWIWVECSACNGTGRYTLRNGHEVDCRVCHGSGNHHKEDCWTCGGTGSVACHVCEGSGDCPKCDGEGDVECRACNGSGTCGKCHGNGSLKCRNCNGTGLCPSCHGRQTIPCRKCSGSGIYQTFKCISLESTSRGLKLKDCSIEKKLDYSLRDIGKEVIFKNNPYIFEFGKQTITDVAMFDLLDSLSDSSYKEKMIQYRSTLLEKSKDAKCSYIETTVYIEKFPIIECVVEYSNENFQFIIIGTDGKVFVDKTPSWWDKFCAFFH